jgi:iron complex outermembrane receptor protein
MPMMGFRGSLLLTAAAIVFGAGGASAQTQMFNFNFPQQSLAESLSGFAQASGQQIIFTQDVVDNLQAPALHGTYTVDAALSRILNGSHLVAERTPSGALMIERARPVTAPAGLTRTAEAAPARAAASVETVVVTSSKIKGDIQTVPIAITALSQEQLTSRQIAGGPDLVKEVPNLTFTKTNFSGYSIQIRGIGTQAISVTTDPAVAVALNDIPFIRNHFFEQEFFDVSQVEVLRGPQGTLYGRNATAGVVNLISAKPTDQFEAMASADWGNYTNRRYEGMINIPIVDDRFDLRVAGEWTKRDGYSFNELTNSPIDGRDLWSSRVTLGLHPVEHLQAYLVWEHFQEDDDRLRSGKQLCKTDYGPGFVAYPPNSVHGTNIGTVDIGGVLRQVGSGGIGGAGGDIFSQGCSPASLYSSDSFEAPLGWAQPYIMGLEAEGNSNHINPYTSETQSHNLRVIASGINPTYKAKNDTLEFNADYALTPSLTFTSQTGFNNDFLWSAEDYNRFGASPGLFNYSGDGVHASGNGLLPDPQGLGVCENTGGVCAGQPLGSVCQGGSVGSFADCKLVGYFCDPQLGCSDRLILEDLSTERAWQFSQEFRLASNFKGPLNFSVGGNYLHYETVEKYYVFGNVLTLINGGYVPGESDSGVGYSPLRYGFQFNSFSTAPFISGGYVDPNPLSNLNDNGHNYFLSKNPYVLNSYAAFGEANYNLTNNLKLTGGLRWTDDKKHFIIIPSWLVESGWGYPVAGTVNQEWNQLTGRAVVNWTPKLDFTDQTLVYGSYAHGYKAGGANPPGAIFSSEFDTPNGLTNPQPTHPLIFKPEFVDAFEIGSKNTLGDGALTLNGDIFYYDYKGYQISEIVDRTAINSNYDAKVKGAELETSWEPAPGLKFNFAGGYEDTRIDNGQSAVDLMDRAAGHAGWYVTKPFLNEASNCVFPAYVAKWMDNSTPSITGEATSYCAIAYDLHRDPFTQAPYVANPTGDLYGFPLHSTDGVQLVDYPGFDPTAGTPNDPYTGQNTDPVTGIDYGPVPNNGAGFSKNLGGHQLPNAPHFTTSLSAEYTIPVSENWAATLHGDFYWQSQSFARVFNDRPYDKIRGYSTTNAALILTGASGWQVIGYVKNVFDATAITGDFLNSDDSGLTTNIFLTDPRLYGVRITKNW